MSLKLTDYKDAYKRADILPFLVAHVEFKTLDIGKDKVILDFYGVMN